MTDGQLDPEAALRAAGAREEHFPPLAGEPAAAAPARPPWPRLGERAYHGPIGAAVRLIEPETEADSAAILLQLLAALGNCVGHGPHVRVEDDRHQALVWTVIVGETAKARKGTSWYRVRGLMRAVAPEWASGNIVSGLSSGEGLIWAVRDPIEEYNENTGAIVTVDRGVADKRKLVVENEFAGVLKMTERGGNTLSPILRDAWDARTLQSLTKNSPALATDPHVTVVGHITMEELSRLLSATEAANGFANRFLFACARRRQLLPEGGRPIAWGGLPDAMGAAIEEAGQVGQVDKTPAARDAWAAAYPALSAGAPGLYGAVTARAEAHALRLALVYALMDGAARIDVPHLAAALAVVQYCLDSARHLFGDATGNPLADRIWRALAAAPAGLDRTGLHNALGRNSTAAAIAGALDELERAGRVIRSKRSTGGRAAEVWRALRP
jgi:uncharacterized protein DUF3987